MSPGLSDLPDPQRATLDDLPPSAKLVALALLTRGRMTQQQLAEETLLSPRTTRHALTKLEDADVVTSRVSFIDARQSLYSVAGNVAETGTGPLLTPE